LVILIWQFVWEVQLISRWVLPSPGATGVDIWDTVTNVVTGGFVFNESLYTLSELLIGFAVAAVGGLVLGIIVGETRFGNEVLMPYLVVINAMPRIALAPVFVAWLGFGIAPKVLLAALIAFFPMIINTALGIRSCTAEEVLLFRSMEARRWQTVMRLKIPTALPNIFAGFRTAIVLAVHGAIVGEFMGGGLHGVGLLITAAAEQLDVARVFALIVLLSALGLALYGLIVWAERRIVHWRPGGSAGGAGRGVR